MKIQVQPSMEMDSFDLIFNFVSMGMGFSIVPHRVIPLYIQSRKIQIIRGTGKNKLELNRKIAVVTRKDRKTPAAIEEFIKGMAF